VRDDRQATRAPRPRPLTHPDGGLYSAFSDGGDPDAAIEDLGSRWELENISLRAWPVGVHLLNPIACLFALLTIGRYAVPVPTRRRRDGTRTLRSVEPRAFEAPPRTPATREFRSHSLTLSTIVEALSRQGPADG